MLTDEDFCGGIPADFGDVKCLAADISGQIVMIVVAPAGARDVAGGQILTISSTRLTRAQGRSRYGAMIGTPAGRDEGGVSGRYGQWLPRRMRDRFSVPLRSQKRASPADGGGPMRR